MSLRQVIHIQVDAPPKPPMGGACNGCGVCCLAEPCPLGSLLSLSRKGPCRMLIWNPAAKQYRCGAFGEPGFNKTWLGALRARLVARWIAAGTGCDCGLETDHFSAMADSDSHAMKSPHD